MLTVDHALHNQDSGDKGMQRERACRIHRQIERGLLFKGSRKGEQKDPSARQLVLKAITSDVRSEGKCKASRWAHPAWRIHPSPGGHKGGP